MDDGRPKSREKKKKSKAKKKIIKKFKILLKMSTLVPAVSRRMAEVHVSDFRLKLDG